MIAPLELTPGFVVEKPSGRLVAVVKSQFSRAYSVWDGRLLPDGRPLVRSIGIGWTYPLADVLPGWWFRPDHDPAFCRDLAGDLVLTWPTRSGLAWTWNGWLDDRAAPAMVLMRASELAEVDPLCEFRRATGT